MGAQQTKCPKGCVTVEECAKRSRQEQQEIGMVPEMPPMMEQEMYPETMPMMENVGLPLGGGVGSGMGQEMGLGSGMSQEMGLGLGMGQEMGLGFGVGQEMGTGMGLGMEQEGLPMELDIGMVPSMEESGLPSDAGMGVELGPPLMLPIPEGEVEGFGTPGSTLLSCSLLIILLVFLLAYMYWDQVSQMDVVKRFK